MSRLFYIDGQGVSHPISQGSPAAPAKPLTNAPLVRPGMDAYIGPQATFVNYALTINSNQEMALTPVSLPSGLYDGVRIFVNVASSTAVFQLGLYDSEFNLVARVPGNLQESSTGTREYSFESPFSVDEENWYFVGLLTLSVDSLGPGDGIPNSHSFRHLTGLVGSAPAGNSLATYWNGGSAYGHYEELPFYIPESDYLSNLPSLHLQVHRRGVN